VERKEVQGAFDFSMMLQGTAYYRADAKKIAPKNTQ
jgi:hypothetical protein